MENNTDVKIARIEECMEALDKYNKEAHQRIEDSLYNLKNNHIDHIYRQLEAQKNWLIGLLVTCIFTLLGVVVNILL